MSLRVYCFVFRLPYAAGGMMMVAANHAQEAVALARRRHCGWEYACEMGELTADGCTPRILASDYIIR